MNRPEKLNVLRQIAMTLAEGSLIPVLSFLAGRLDGIRFVEDTDGAAVSVHLSSNVRLWPHIPFRATIDGTAINNPIAFIDRVSLRDDPIYVRVDFGAVGAPKWYQDVVEEGVVDRRHQMETRIEEIREKIDLALDAYRTANEAIGTAEDDEQQYLRFVLSRAKDDMRTLNQKLSELETRLGWREP